MSFATAVAFVLAREGGELVSDPNDPGGLSRYGIALRRHPELSAADIRAMTAERARAIYAGSYWSAVKGDELPEHLQLPMLDAAVNMGPGSAIKALQRALYLSADGLLGPQTLKAAATADARATLAGLTSERIAHYSALQGWQTFGRGWTKRAVLAALEA